MEAYERANLVMVGVGKVPSHDLELPWAIDAAKKVPLMLLDEGPEPQYCMVSYDQKGGDYPVLVTTKCQANGEPFPETEESPKETTVNVPPAPPVMNVWTTRRYPTVVNIEAAHQAAIELGRIP